MIDQGRKSDLHDLKIALQVLGHDGLKVAIPAISTLVGLATCAGLFVWSLGELQKFSPNQVVRRIELSEQNGTPVKFKPIAPVRPATPAAVRKVARKPAKKMAIASRAPRQSRARTYDSYWETDNPTGGRVTRSNGYSTDYSWQ
jgi:hypothetical protein